jgi:peptide/nickel transport system substrate-binding protein
MSVEENPQFKDRKSVDSLILPDGSRSGESGITRRHMMARGAQGLALLGAGSLLAACGSSSSTGGAATGGSSTTGGGGKPVKGGALTVGMVTAGSAETLNPGAAGPWVDLLRIYQLYDFLFQPGPGQNFSEVEPRLATEAEPNKDASAWTLQLRDGVTWHDGKPFTADDVVWSIKSWSSASNYAHGYAAPFIDFKKVRKRGKLAVEIPLLKPTAQFPTLLMIYSLAMIQDGATPKSLSTNPVGTGPFKFVSFTPGSQSVFARNDSYWEGGGKPYVDEVIVNSSFQDDTSRYNALQGGQIDIAAVFPPNFARQQQEGGPINVLSSPSGQGYGFPMRIDKGPFTDQRVREAMKLLCDRKALIDGVFSGFGQPGNDLEGAFTQYFADDLKAEFDVEKAKSLLKAAGQEDLSVTLQTSNAGVGYVEAATLYAQQAEAAGVKVNVEQISPSTYFTEAGGYLSNPFRVISGNSWPSMTQVASTYYVTGAPYDETGWTKQPGGGNQALISAASASLDENKAEELWHEFQVETFEKNGMLLWAFLDFVDAASSKVEGLSAGIANPLNNFRLLDAWMSS